jgi:RNA recognition motif-containing protein
LQGSDDLLEQYHKHVDADDDHCREHLRKLFVGGLTYATTDAMLREFYKQYGEVVDCGVVRDPVENRSRGFGFVAFASGMQVGVCVYVSIEKSVFVGTVRLHVAN